MPDGPVLEQVKVQVHSLLHTNLNTVDLSAAAAFYADVLGLKPGMKTARTAADGRALGVAGATVTECWFLYDHRGPRTAPAIEVLEWETPPTTGAHPAEPYHTGISSLGYTVPSLEHLRERAARHGRPWTELAAWPVRGTATAAARTTDLDGVPIELTERTGEAPVFSHLRINVTDLDASVAWYGGLGFTAMATVRSAEADKAVFSCASMVTEGDPSFSLELTQWEDPKGTGLAASPAYHRGLYRIALGVDDVNAAYRQLAGTAEKPLNAPEFVELPGTRLGGVSVLFLRDPDGVVVELVGRSRSHMRR
ncbi:MAG TPA: VOC family protein [Streptosporangiaceae bacterium]|jgi:catechol 2,3-dioxygenase-like lactoylglutathione lyase family enzyme|nr:VOC family protein [Streptosporangiaceae bacterium]